MARLVSLLFSLLAITGFASRCLATTYTVGDSSGWDISTDVDSWAQNKHFVVSDVLLFQYSSSHSVGEVSRDSYEGCNTTNVLQASSNGNTTFALTTPGDRYFVCGNRLHCYAGMKLHVVVDDKAGADGPSAAPEAEAGGDSTTTTTNTPPKNKKPPSIIPNSVMPTIRFKSLLFVCFTCLLSWII
ncbi:stellacyanin-like [Bidens hawaiensis]|uniref:stellacyanin-like n=1 Tax=Bidens hawaiensis TaxID=980011 RepID=UPI00404B4222